jgi:hypothetical protein
MKYFISHIPACHLYAKCPGWQETLAHFFVKTRRGSLAQSLPRRSSSQDASSTSTKEQSLDSSHGSSNFMSTTDNSRQVSTSSPVFDITITPDDSLSDKQIDKMDPSMIESQTDYDLTQTYGFSDQPIASNSIVITVNNKQTTNDYQGYTNDTIITPPHSLSDSREDFLSPFKPDYLNINQLGLVRNRNDLSTLQRSTTTMTTSMTTSMTMSFEGKDIYEEHRKLSSSLREYLGSPKCCSL